MTKRITGIVQTIVLVLALVGTAISGERTSDLLPEDGIFSGISPAYDLALRDLLLDEHHLRLCQMLVAPYLLDSCPVFSYTQKEANSRISGAAMNPIKKSWVRDKCRS